MAALAEHRQQEGRQRHAPRNTASWASAAFEQDPPSTFAPCKTRSALRTSRRSKRFRDATSADYARAGKASAAPRVLDAYREYVTVVPSEAARRKAAFAAMAARATGPSVAHAWKHWRRRSHPPPRPPGERARGLVRGRGEGLGQRLQAGARDRGCRRGTLETLGAGRGGDA